MALSLGSRRAGVTRHRFLWGPDFPREYWMLRTSAFCLAPSHLIAPLRHSPHRHRMQYPAAIRPSGACSIEISAFRVQSSVGIEPSHRRARNWGSRSGGQQALSNNTTFPPHPAAAKCFALKPTQHLPQGEGKKWIFERGLKEKKNLRLAPQEATRLSEPASLAAVVRAKGGEG